jgi:hypothetical protein
MLSRMGRAARRLLRKSLVQANAAVAVSRRGDVPQESGHRGLRKQQAELGRLSILAARQAVYDRVDVFALALDFLRVETPPGDALLADA